MSPLAPTICSLGDVARSHGLQLWQVHRALARAGLVLPKIGPTRVVDAEHLPAVEAALRRAGYLQETPGESAASA